MQFLRMSERSSGRKKSLLPIDQLVEEIWFAFKLEIRSMRMGSCLEATKVDESQLTGEADEVKGA